MPNGTWLNPSRPNERQAIAFLPRQKKHLLVFFCAEGGTRIEFSKASGFAPAGARVILGVGSRHALLKNNFEASLMPKLFCAEGGTRTHKPVKALAPKANVSTNFTTSAGLT